MSIITMPSALRVELAGGFVIGQRRFDVENDSDANGNAQSRLFSPPKWTIAMRSPAGLEVDDAVEWEAMLLQLRGRINHLAAWDRGRPAPRGTMRGTLSLSAGVAAGATTLSITGGAGQANTTLKKGDWLGLGTGVGTSQLVKVMSNAQANGSGVISVVIEPPTRAAFSVSTAVAWDKPVAYFKATTSDTSWGYHSQNAQTGFAFDGVEQWT
jgi:hypothetical protein